MPSARQSITILLILATFGLAACENTIRGVGRDVRSTGQAVEDAVEGR